MSPSAAPLVRVIRSGLEESIHLGHVAVCDADGRLVAWLGDPDRPVFARSCMKPLQASVSLKTTGEEQIPDREVAIMCASHNGEPVHVGAVRAVLRRAGLGPDALRNPPGWPMDERSMARAHHPSREFQDCSGKHAGMLLASVRNGWSTDTYRRRSHPLQRRILGAVLAASGLHAVEVGVDGCGVPVYGMPLRAMATVYARLARPERLGTLEPSADRAVAAMLSEPYLVGGRDRVDTAIMSETGDVLVKSGAEALECASVLSSGLGVAIKIADGGYRATPPAMIDVLRQLDALTAAQVAHLGRFSRPVVTGGGEPVGSLVAKVPLRRK
jgi:L-asparaginase II